MRRGFCLLSAVRRQRRHQEIGIPYSDPDGFRVAENQGFADTQSADTDGFGFTEDQSFAHSEGHDFTRGEDHNFTGGEHNHRCDESAGDSIPRNDFGGR